MVREAAGFGGYSVFEEVIHLPKKLDVSFNNRKKTADNYIFILRASLLLSITAPEHK